MSSKRAIRRKLFRKQCKDKMQYDTIHAAQVAAYISGRRYKARMNAYGCKFCGGFHVGNMPRWLRRRIDKKKGLLI